VKRGGIGGIKGEYREIMNKLASMLKVNEFV
jgi:hypothetical protein